MKKTLLPLTLVAFASLASGLSHATTSIAVAVSRVGAFAVSAPPVFTTSLSQYGMTWSFGSSVEYGQFLNGDYWVVDPGSGVVVSSVSPGWTDGKNGSMKNPQPHNEQAFNAAATDFNIDELVTFPTTLVAGDALISSVSVTPGTQNWAGGNIGSNVHVKDAAILTVLAAAPQNPSMTFRPCPVDRNQTMYTTDQIDRSVLTGLSTAGLRLPDHAGFDSETYFVRGTARPWLLWGSDWQSRAIHPTNNMFDYHEKIGHFLSEIMVIIMSDQVTDAVLNGFLQVVIDYYHSGNADSSLWAAPYVLGGLILNEADIYNYWINNPHQRTQRAHEKLFYPEDNPDHDNWKVSSIVPPGEIWTGYVHPVSGRSPMFSKQTDSRVIYYAEHLHPSEWVEDAQCTASIDSQCKGEVYRTQHDVYPLVGMTLATILADYVSPLDVNAMLAHDVIRDYIDRWMTEDFMHTEYKSTGRSFNEEMRFYRTFTTYYYNYMSSKSGFVDDMWHRYRDGIDLQRPDAGVSDSSQPDGAGSGDACNVTHYWRCNTLACQDLGLYWWEDACRTIPEPTDWSGSNVIDNGRFSAWTDGVPDGWDVPYHGTSVVSNDNDAARLYSDGGIWCAVRQEFAAPGDTRTYRYVANVHSRTEDMEVYTLNEGSTFHTEIGTVTGLVTAHESNAWIYFQVRQQDGVQVAVVDDIVIKQIEDPTLDGGFPDLVVNSVDAFQADSASPDLGGDDVWTADSYIADGVIADGATESDSTASTQKDAQTPNDRSAEADAGVTAIGRGCGCQQSTSLPSATVLIGLVLLLVLRRRSTRYS